MKTVMQVFFILAISEYMCYNPSLPLVGIFKYLNFEKAPIYRQKFHIPTLNNSKIVGI